MDRTNVVLNDRSLRQALCSTGTRTKRQAVDLALREMVARASVCRPRGDCRGSSPGRATMTRLASCRSRADGMSLGPPRSALEGRQCSDPPSRLLLGEAQLVETLEVEPEFRAGAEEMAEA